MDGEWDVSTQISLNAFSLNQVSVVYVFLLSLYRYVFIILNSVSRHVALRWFRLLFVFKTTGEAGRRSSFFYASTFRVGSFYILFCVPVRRITSPVSHEYIRRSTSSNSLPVDSPTHRASSRWNTTSGWRDGLSIPCLNRRPRCYSSCIHPGAQSSKGHLLRRSRSAIPSSQHV